MKTKWFAAFGMLTVLLAATSFCQSAGPERGGEKKIDPALLPIEDTAGLPRVLLIGDSISIGYTLPVREALKGKANVHRIPENGNATGVGLKKLPEWLGQGHWDVIHFNWGLHDLKHWNWEKNRMDINGPQVTALADYEKNLRELVKQLKATGAKLVWASTTPVPQGSDGRVPGDEDQYNAVAARVMKENGVAIDDLNAAAHEKLAEIQLPKNVHYTPGGYRFLAEKVAASITAQLGGK